MEDGQGRIWLPSLSCFTATVLTIPALFTASRRPTRCQSTLYPANRRHILPTDAISCKLNPLSRQLPPYEWVTNYLAEIWSGSEEDSHLRLIDCCITQLQAQEWSRREEEEWVTRVGDDDAEMTERPSSLEALLFRRINLVRGFGFNA